MSVVTPLPTAALAEEMLGEVGKLTGALGRPQGAGNVAHPPLGVTEAATHFEGYRQQAERYCQELLVAHEWPLIIQSFEFARRGEARELIALDQEWERTRNRSLPHLKGFAEASVTLGQRELGRLRPLRDQRLVHRYLAAIERGDARGWHPLVYGVVLAVFSLPLRTGLVHYSCETIIGCLAGTPYAPESNEPRSEEIVDAVLISLQPALQRLPMAAWVAV